MFMCIFVCKYTNIFICKYKYECDKYLNKYEFIKIHKICKYIYIKFIY